MEKQLSLEPVSKLESWVVSIDGIEDEAPNDPNNDCEARFMPDRWMVLLEDCRADVEEHQETEECDHEV